MVLFSNVFNFKKLYTIHVINFIKYTKLLILILITFITFCFTKNFVLAKCTVTGGACAISDLLNVDKKNPPQKDFSNKNLKINTKKQVEEKGEYKNTLQKNIKKKK